MPDIPMILRPEAVTEAFERLREVKTPLARFFSTAPNTLPGISVKYDLIEHGRQRGRVNSRGGRPNYEGGPTERTVSYDAFTWREAARIEAHEMKDLRKPGTAAEKRGMYAVASKEFALRNRLTRFQEWLRACGLQGVAEFYPPGLDETYSELLLTSEDYISATVTYDWSTAPANEATARLTLIGIRDDLEVARIAMAAAGCTMDAIIVNDVTGAYLDDNALMAGIDIIEEAIYRDGRIVRIFGYDVVRDEETYVHPITGSDTNYIPDNVCVCIDSNNARGGRTIRECEVESLSAPDDTIGAFFTSKVHTEEEPGWAEVVGEWNGGVEVKEPGSIYVYQDVTST